MDANELLVTIEKGMVSMAALVNAYDARTLPALENALSDAALRTEAGTAEVAQANMLKNSLVAEAACSGALAKVSN